VRIAALTKSHSQNMGRGDGGSGVELEKMRKANADAAAGKEDFEGAGQLAAAPEACPRFLVMGRVNPFISSNAQRKK